MKLIKLFLNLTYIDYRLFVLDKKQKATINPINKRDNICFQYDITIALYHKKTKKDRQRIIKIKPFINKYNWKGINSGMK